MPSEFDLIRRFFSREPASETVRLGVGDDAAVLQPPSGYQLVQTMDTMVEGVHFYADAPADTLGHKIMAVNLSDLAAMGAEPAWALLSLTLPEPDQHWLRAFSDGLYALADQHGVVIVGGDTCRGSRSLTLQATGVVPPDQYLRRSGAQPGDLVYVSGVLGDAGLALAHLDGRAKLSRADREAVMPALLRPVPRIELGRRIRPLATAAIDLSDGLLSDLRHLLNASAVGAHIELPRLPLSAPVRRSVETLEDWTLPLCSGDDYELCFTIADCWQDRLEQIATDLQLPLTWIGHITRQPGIVWRGLESGWRISGHGFDHFEPEGE